jgi:molybdenum cofactor biosynthesis enzyme MoaA
MAWTPHLSILGTVVIGDLGDHTIYTNSAGKKVWFDRVKPHDPPSYARNLQRVRFKWAQARWQALAADQKFALEEASRRTSLVMTGQNMFISCLLKRRPDLYATIQHQSGIELPPLPETV